MYLSRVPLDLSKRKTQIALASPNKFHGAVEESFSGSRERNLWRIDTLRGRTYLLLLSVSKPDLSGITEQFGNQDAAAETKEYTGLLERITEGSIWHFRLVANPVHSIKTEKGRGKVAAHITEKYQLEWLDSQAEKKGFHLIPNTACVREANWKIFKKIPIKKYSFLRLPLKEYYRFRMLMFFRMRCCMASDAGKHMAWDY